jgi:6-oxo-cyclohex-1-ene-carbonyl-CoA hydrolase
MTDLSWLPRENDLKDHSLFEDQFFGNEAPCVKYEKRPIVGQNGKPVEGLYSAWIWLNNPGQYNSYTTGMAKGIVAGFQKASSDRSVVVAVFTAVGDKAFCSGGNTVEYASYYSKRPNEYGEYMDLFNAMVDGILNCKKPVICRVNGMRVGGGQELGMAADLAVTSRSTGRPVPGTVPRPTGAPRIFCPGISASRTQCTTASRASPGAHTR